MVEILLSFKSHQRISNAVYQRSILTHSKDMNKFTSVTSVWGSKSPFSVWSKPLDLILRFIPSLLDSKISSILCTIKEIEPTVKNQNRNTGGKEGTSIISCIFVEAGLQHYLILHWEGRPGHSASLPLQEGRTNWLSYLLLLLFQAPTTKTYLLQRPLQQSQMVGMKYRLRKLHMGKVTCTYNKTKTREMNAYLARMST